MLCLQVEKAPVTVKTGLKKEEAEELKKKLEAGEASIQILRLKNIVLMAHMQSSMDRPSLRSFLCKLHCTPQDCHEIWYGNWWIFFLTLQCCCSWRESDLDIAHVSLSSLAVGQS